MSSILEPYRLFFDHRQVFWAAVKQTLKARHAGSILGSLWLLIGPLILLSLYAILYTLIFRVRPVNMSVPDYILYIFCGLIPFISFSQALAAGSAALSANNALLLNRMFPAELIPAREVVASGMFMVVGGAVTITYKALTGGVTAAWLLLPVIVALMTMATCGGTMSISTVRLAAAETALCPASS